MSDPQTIEPEDIRVLRENAANAQVNEARAIAAERRIAFLEAGVDTTSDIGQLFVAAYPGELTADAIQEAAARVGALRQATPPPAVEGQPGQAPPTQQQGQNYDPVEAALQTLARNGTQGEIPGGAPTPPVDPDPIERGYEAYTADVNAGRRREDAATHVLFGILEAAGKGDARVLFDPARDREGTKRKIVTPNSVMGL